MPLVPRSVRIWAYFTIIIPMYLFYIRCRKLVNPRPHTPVEVTRFEEPPVVSGVYMFANFVGYDVPQNGENVSIPGIFDPEIHEPIDTHGVIACNYQRQYENSAHRILFRPDHIISTDTDWPFSSELYKPLPRRGAFVRAVAQPGNIDVSAYFHMLDGRDNDFGQIVGLTFKHIANDIVALYGFNQVDVQWFELSTIDINLKVSLREDVCSVHVALTNQ